MSTIKSFVESLCHNTTSDIVRWRDTVDGVCCDYTAVHDGFVYQVNCDRTNWILSVNGKKVFLSETDRTNICQSIASQKIRMSELDEIISAASRSLAKTVVPVV